MDFELTLIASTTAAKLRRYYIPPAFSHGKIYLANISKDEIFIQNELLGTLELLPFITSDVISLESKFAFRFLISDWKYRCAFKPIVADGSLQSEKLKKMIFKHCEATIQYI